MTSNLLGTAINVAVNLLNLKSEAMFTFSSEFSIYPLKKWEIDLLYGKKERCEQYLCRRLSSGEYFMGKFFIMIFFCQLKFAGGPLTFYHFANN